MKMLTRVKTPSSLAWRLGLSVAAVAAAGSALLGAYLYHSFEQQLLRRDDVQLLGKLRQLRQLLAHSGTPELLRQQADYLRDTMSGESNALIEIHAGPEQGGALLLSVNPARRPLPRTPPLALNREAQLSDILHGRREEDGVPSAALTAWAQLGELPVELRLARVYPERSALLAEYRLRIAASSLGAGGLAAGLVLLLVWRGLAPLRRLRSQAAAIGPQSLASRLHDADMPEELRPLVASINTMLTRLEQGYAQLQQFAADLAHELRTPLSVLTNQNQVMLSRPRSKEEYTCLLDDQLQELERLNRLVDSLLFLARSEHEALAGRLQREALSATAELARQADYFADLAEDRGLRLHWHCSGEAEVCVWAEAQMLRRALANLISNALRHARPGTVIELSARYELAAAATDGPGQEAAAKAGPSAATSAAASAPGFAILEVSNEGTPLPEALLPRLFDRFFRADPSRAGEHRHGPMGDDAAGVDGGHSSNNSGLGLAIVQRIMNLHGGHASVHQSPQGCIHFVLWFPQAAARAD